MAEKKQWIGKDTFPTIWVWICVLFNIIGILAVIMLIIAEIIIIANDFNNYVDQYGHSYRIMWEKTDVGSWAGRTPRKLSSLDDLIPIFATLVIASDLAWRQARYNEWGGHYVSMFYAGGILAGDHNKGLFYYVIANGFLKIFLVVLYMSQSFYGLKGGSHAPPDLDRINDNGGVVLGGRVTQTITTLLATTATAIAPTITSTTIRINTAQPTGTIITGQNGGAIIPPDLPIPISSIGTQVGESLMVLKRATGFDPDDPGAAYGTELWAQWAGWIVLGSIIPSIIAFMFLVPWAAKKNEESKPADAEKGKDASK